MFYRRIPGNERWNLWSLMWITGLFLLITWFLLWIARILLWISRPEKPRGKKRPVPLLHLWSLFRLGGLGRYWRMGLLGRLEVSKERGSSGGFEGP